MEREEIETMGPGRELDALVAKALGQQWSAQPPRYSQDMKDAWDAIEILTKRDVWIEIRNFDDYIKKGGVWEVEVLGWFAAGPQAPLAICHAILFYFCAQETTA